MVYETGNRPHPILNLSRKLMRLATVHKRLAETACNRELCNREMVKQDHVEAEIRRLINEDDPGLYKNPLKIIADFGGDPRGCTVKLKFPSGFTNDFGGEGVCVPQ